MNINTGTLLGMLSPKLTNIVKEKIEKASVDGKVNLNEIVKDSSVRTVLNNLIHDVATGAKNKESVLNLLENSKQTLSFKNFSADIKTLAKAIENSPVLQTNTKLMEQVGLLKNSMIDLSKIDAKTIMNSFSNSGIFLESKLLQQSIPISDVISRAVNMLTQSVKSFNPQNVVDLPKQISKQVDLMMIDKNIPRDLKLEIKTAINNLLNEFSKSFSTPQQIQQHSQSQAKGFEQLGVQEKVLNQLSSSVQKGSEQNIAATKGAEQNAAGSKVLENVISLLNEKLPSGESRSQLINNLQSLFSNLQNLTPNEKTTLVNTITQQTHQSVIPKEIPNDIKLEVKNAVANLLRPVQTPANIVQNFQNTLVALEQKVTNNLPNTQLSTNLPPLLKELSTTLKEGFTVKENIPVLKNLFSTLTQKVDISSLDTQLKGELKNDLQNLSSQLKTLQNPVNIEQKAQTLQNVFENLKTFSTKLETILTKLPQGQMENIPKNLANDLKGVVMQIQEHLDNSNEPLSRELRAVVDKIGTQVEFFQLLSYTSNSNHSVLSFMQENIEDSDIKFHKTDEDTYSCQINLNLKNFGELKVFLVLDKFQNLGINIGVEDGTFKKMLQENLQELRSRINSIELLLQALNVFDINNEQISKEKQIKGYGESGSLSFGVDIQV
jgi:hypothetical protein